MLYLSIVFLPGLAALFSGVFGRILGHGFSMFLTSISVSASALISFYIFLKVIFSHKIINENIEVLSWIKSGDLNFSWSIMVDSLTLVMFVVVTSVSALVHWYSFGYMKKDPHKSRFFTYLSLFTFAMLMLVSSDNFVQLFFGWEGVGLCSYLLIGFWFKKPTANAAAIKAFIVNRIGDFGFALGIMAIFLFFNSVSYESVFSEAADFQGKKFIFLGVNLDLLTVITMLLFIGAMGKSAQFLLHTWLPDAMEGPTPVSALIHAATMVTAGVFMVVRCSPLFEYAPFTLNFIILTGAITAFFAASVAIVQNDIKRVIAYSTCSQLGYMFIAVGLSAYSVAIFHLFTHAFFKALLFLASGSVIHAVSDEQDMRKMGGLYTLLPVTYLMVWIGSLALAGIPIFSGFFSKDLIIEIAFAGTSSVSSFAFWIALLAAFLTAFYSWRLIFLTFHGKTRIDQSVMSHVHEAPLSMSIPMILLALGAIFSGILCVGLMTGHHSSEFWGQSLFVFPGRDLIDAAHALPFIIKILPVIVSIIGIILAWYFYIYKPNTPNVIAKANQPLYLFLLNKWYFDELYDFLFVKPSRWLGYFLWKRGDGNIIDGIGPDGFSSMVNVISKKIATLQSGLLYHYAFVMLAGIVLFISWFLLV
ncbi:MAG: NADH-quinone oxidoreductase subunit L [Rhodospirillaceae bacterium]|nr:NADH-quinone oxidoreductase subunit L [Rhodospirillaceae bacterium]